MSLLQQSVELGAVMKVAVFAAGLAGSFALLRDDIGDLQADKASNERVAVLEERDAQTDRRIVEALESIDKRLETIERRLETKADKP